MRRSILGSWLGGRAVGKGLDVWSRREYRERLGIGTLLEVQILLRFRLFEGESV